MSLEFSPSPNDPALRRRNVRTALWILAVIATSMAFSYFGRHLMVPVLFKVG